jgi:hypothetical protein
MPLSAALVCCTVWVTLLLSTSTTAWQGTVPSTL